MSLNPTFALTPSSPSYYGGAGNSANLYCFGADFFPYSPYSLQAQCANDGLYFNGSFAADPAQDYANYLNLRRSRYIELYCDLSSFGNNKQLALVFGFDFDVNVGSDARLLIYSNNGQLHDVTLVQGDNQFLIEVESLSQAFFLYFIHALLPNLSYGGNWFFKGITGYVI